MKNLLPNNAGTLDRVLRAMLGLGLLSLTVVGPQTMWGLVGLIPLGTALLGSCPVYTILGVSTCSIKGQS